MVDREPQHHIRKRYGVREDPIVGISFFVVVQRTTFHSWRSAPIGSTREARLAGRYAATTAMASISTAVAASIAGSVGDTPNRRLVTKRAAPNTKGIPAARPISTRISASRSTSHTTEARRAPNAVRIPISAVLRATAYEIRP